MNCSSVSMCFTLSVSPLLLDLNNKEPHFWQGRNTIVHLMEWKWKDIADECERFLQHKGYAGVQTSPPSENLIIEDRPWWERYQLVSYNLTTRSGTEEEFADMIRRCNAVGIRIYPDAIINHTTARSGLGTAGNFAYFEKQSYPALGYEEEDFNEDCPLYGWDDAIAVRNCRLKGLIDLNQTVSNVRKTTLQYMNKLIKMGVAGFRVDAAKHVWPVDLEYIYSHLDDLNVQLGYAPGSRPFIYQEVPENGIEPISKYEYTPLGRIVEFKHSFEISNMFRGNNKLTYLANWGPEWGFVPQGDAVAFIDNHDSQRRDDMTLRYKEAKQYKMALAFMFAHPYGKVTRIISSYFFGYKNQPPPADAHGNLLSPGLNPDGTCSNGYVCEHRWRQVFNMVQFKNVVDGTEITNWWSNDDQQIAFCRGNKGFVVFTNWGDVDRILQTCLPPGIYCDVVSGELGSGGCSGKVVSVREDGTAHITLGALEEDGMLAIHIKSKVVELKVEL